MTRVTGDSSLQTAILEDLSDAQRYRRWLADLARPHLGDHPIEIGSGIGDYALEWISDVTRFTATEADLGRLADLRARFARHPVIRVRHLHLGQPAANPAGDESPNGNANGATAGPVPGGRVHTGAEAKPETAQHSAAVAINVLEHIPDHVGALRAMANLVRPGGAVVLIVPAFPSAMSQFDRAIGHERRYTRTMLGDTLDAAGLRIEQLRYLNPVGLLGWYITVKTLRMTPRNGLALRVYDRTVVPLARAADRLHSPFGQSVFAVARVG